MRSFIESKPAHTQIDNYKTSYNVGCRLDIPTGKYVRGMKGESINTGGHGTFVGIVGKNNLFKSTLMHYMTLAASGTVAASGYEPYINTFDTETNIHIERLRSFYQRFPVFADHDLFDSKIWMVTDITKHLGDEWYKLLRDFLRNVKMKNLKKYTMQTPFIGTDGEPISVLYPTFGQIDSVSKFMTSSVEDIQNKNMIGDSANNTLFMRQGLAKAQLLAELPIMCSAAAHYMIATAHVTMENQIGVQPHQMPTKKLQHMKSGEKIKGAPDDFFFLTNSLWQTTTANVLNDQATKSPLYPRHRGDCEEGSTDLNVINLKLLRNKSGPSGCGLQVLVSQTEGILPGLTEFHAIKEADRYGLEGNNTSYRLDLMPSVTIGRTSVRETIDTDPRVRRAVKITSDFQQIKEHYRDLPLEIPPLAQLYAKLDKQYGWDKILNTRDFWTFDQYENAVPFLSTMDILEAYHDRYVPYFLK